MIHLPTNTTIIGVLYSNAFLPPDWRANIFSGTWLETTKSASNMVRLNTYQDTQSTQLCGTLWWTNIAMENCYLEWIFPLKMVIFLVSLQKAMENHHAINGNIHYFDWAIFNCELLVHQRVPNFVVYAHELSVQKNEVLVRLLWLA